MSSSIDSRILSLKFDGSSFQRGVSATLAGLQRLQNALKLPGAKKGLQDVQSAADRTNLSKLEASAGSVNAKFSSMAALAAGALMSIGSKAAEVGLSVAKALTIQPMMDGFHEYETQMGAVQTILANTASKGTTIKDVNGTLADLNNYADKTIYSFTEMTKNIGTFTAAGVGLKPAAEAIKGISNLAAMSGSTSEQASTAMYQLSQAMASDKVGLQDWNSVVNAGMGGENFQKTLIGVADALDRGGSAAVKKAGSFRDSLKSGWINGDVLTKSLKLYTGEMTEAQIKAMGFTDAQAKAFYAMGQNALHSATDIKTFSGLMDTLKEATGSGWATTWQTVLGDFEQSKKLWTGVGTVLTGMVNKSSQARNKMLSDWAKAGGRDTLIKGLSDAFTTLMNVMRPIGQAFREIFPATTGAQLAQFTRGFANLMATMKNSVPAQKLHDIFKGLFSILDIGRMFIVGFVKGLLSLMSGAGKAGGGLLSFLATIGNFVTRVRDAIKQGDIFTKFFVGIANVLKGVGGLFAGVGGGLGKMVSNFVAAVPGLGQLGKSLEGAAKQGTLAQKVFGALGTVGKVIGDILGKLGSVVGSAVQNVVHGFGLIFQHISFNNIITAIGMGSMVALIAQIKKMFGTLDSLFSKGVNFKAGGAFGTIKETLETTTEALKSMQTSIKAATLLEIAAAIALLAGSLSVLSKIDAAGLAKGLGAITVLMGELFLMMAGLTKIMSAGGVAGMVQVSASMILLSTAVRILAGAVKTLSSLSWTDLIKGLGGVLVLMGGMTASVIAISSASGEMMVGAAGLIAFAAAIRILAGAVKELATLDLGSLAKGLVGVGVLCAELAVFMKVANFGGIGPGVALGLIGLGAAIKILASAVGDFASLNIGNLTKGLVAMGIVLAQLTIFSKFTGGGASLIATGAAMIELGIAMNILAGAVGSFASMSLGNLVKGLLGMAAALGIVALAMAVMPKNMFVTGAGMVVVASAITILTAALQTMGSMSLEQIGKSLLALAGSLTILAVALTFMGGTLLGSASLMAAALALNVLTPVLITLGSMSLSDLGIALLGLAGAFVVIAAGGLLLTPLVPTLLAFSLAIAGVGAAMLLAGVGISLGAAGLQLAWSVLGPILTGLLQAFMAIGAYLPVFVTLIGSAMLAFVNALITAAPQIGLAMIAIGTQFLTAIASLAPQAGVAILAVITTILTVIRGAAGQFISTGTFIIMSFLNAIGTVLPRAIQVMSTIIVSMLNAIVRMIPSFVNTAVAVMNGLLSGVNRIAPNLINTMGRVIMLLISKVAVLIPQLVVKGAQMVTNILNGLAQKMPGMVTAAGNLIVAFLNGLNSQVPRITAAGLQLATTVITSITGGLANQAGSLMSGATNAASWLIQGFVNGISNGIQNVVNVCASMASSAVNTVKSWLHIASPSKVFTEIGMFTAMGFAKGIAENTSSVVDEATNMATSTTQAVQDALSGSMTGLDAQFNPVVTPVIDLTSLQEGAKGIGDILAQNPLDLAATLDAANAADPTKSAIGSDPSLAPSTETPIVNLTQNNYSPKALSTAEIYRKTRNQLSIVGDLLPR